MSRATKAIYEVRAESPYSKNIIIYVAAYSQDEAREIFEFENPSMTITDIEYVGLKKHNSRLSTLHW